MMRTDNAFGYNAIMASSREVDRLLEEGLIDADDYGCIPLLEAKIANSRVLAAATEARTDIEYAELLDEVTILMDDNYGLREKIQKLTTELGEFKLKSSTADLESPGWMSGGYNLPVLDTSTTESDQVAPSTTTDEVETRYSARMTMTEEADLVALNGWPLYLSFSKGDRVRDIVTGKEGLITGWTESADRYRVIYTMESDTLIYPIEGLGEEFVLIERADEIEAKEVIDERIPEAGAFFGDEYDWFD